MAHWDIGRDLFCTDYEYLHSLTVLNSKLVVGQGPGILDMNLTEPMHKDATYLE